MVVGYLPTWSGYPNSVNNVDLTKITHLNIAFANPNADGDIIMSDGTLINLGTVVTAAHNANVKILVSIGGAGAPGSTYNNLIVNSQTAFIDKIVQFAVDNNLDGIDVDIEGDVLNGTTLNSTQYEGFIVELETALHAENKLMTAALATWFAFRVTNLAASKFDFINLMSYDAYGTWTGPGQHSSYSFAVEDLTYWSTTKAVPLNKLTVGVPFYGYRWTNTGSAALNFIGITNLYTNSEFSDEARPANGGIVYYNGIPTIKQKTALAIEQAGGIMIWQLTGDATGAKSLLSAIDEVIQGHSTNIAPTVSISSPTASTSFNEGENITVSINASDADGDILKTDYFAGTFKIGETYGAPTDFIWSGAGAGVYSITVAITDNLGKTTVSSAVSITVNAASSSLPFSGTAISIPGKVEAENFNLGGNNVAYRDLTAVNSGGVYRTGRVDIENCVDAGGGHNVGWIDGGEWLEYTIDVTTNGVYDFSVRSASQNADAVLYIEMDGVNITGNIELPNTSGWQKWQTTTLIGVSLSQGLKKMRIQTASGGFNLNYVEILTSTATSVTNSATNNSATTTIYPNPLSNSATLRFHLKQSGNTKIVIIDLFGKELINYHNLFFSNGQQEYSLQTSELPVGIYICLVTTENETKAIRFTKE